MADLDKILEDRGSKYGPFSGYTGTTQELVRVLQKGKTTTSWINVGHKDTMVFDEVMHMIALKLARIVNGDPSHIDSWADIAGYAQLVVRHLEGREIGE